MNEIKNKKFAEERALYNLKETRVISCNFEGALDGESALKETRNIIIDSCFFALRYPLWHSQKFEIINSHFNEFSRAPLWYSINGKINKCDINVIKAITDMGEAVKPAVISKIDAQFAIQGIEAEASQVIQQITDLTGNFSIFGIDLTVNPTVGLNLYMIIPILTFVFAFLSQKIIRKYTYQPQQTQEAQSSMAMMEWTMPLLSVWISFSVPAAIAIYWMIQNVLSAAQQIALHKMYPIPPVTDEQIKEAELKYKGKSANKAKKATLPEPDYNSPIYEEVPEVELEEKNLEVNDRPLGLTPKIKKHLKETGKPLKARRKI